MKNKIQSFNHPLKHRIWSVLTMVVFLFTFAIGNVWADEIFGFTVTSSTTAKGSYSATGGTAECTGSAMSTGGSNEITVGTQTFYKFSSSSQWTFTLSSGKFAAGDVISFTCACQAASGSNKNGKGIAIQTDPVITVTGNFPKGETNTISYTVVADDGIAGESSFSIKRNDSDIKFGTVSVTRSSGDTPVCPSGLTISSKDSKTAFIEGDAIELTASLSAGNGDISYQWYKGGTAEGNKLTGKTTNKLQIASCTTSDAGDYYCVASKTSCSDAVNASAFAITVAADTKCFNMPAITSKPDNIGAITVSGGTLADVGVGKTLKMQSTGIGFGNGNAARLQVTLTSASIIEGTKITVYYNNASSDGSGIGLYNENYEHQVINETGVTGSGNFSHTFTAEEAANYTDVFLIDRNNTGKGIIVGSITVEDCGPAVTKHTITLNYNDGATPDGSLKVVDGNAAVKPTDPTRGKYTFLGWFVGDTDNEYVWSTAVTGDITLKAHWQDPWTITFDANGGSAVADITVKHNTKAEKPEDPTYAGHDFDGWYYGEPEVAFDWDANVTANYSLKAHWIAEVAKYDIEYYDGETKIGTEEQVRADQHPTASGIETSKPLYSFDGWFLNSALTGDPVALNTVTPSEGLKLYGKWTKAYATSYDMEAYAVSDGATLETLLSNLDAAGYAYTNVNGIDNGHTHNYIYDGMKYKTNDGDLSFNVNADKLVIVKTGNLPANALTMYINGVADPTVFVGANEAVETHVNNYFYSEADALYRLDIQASKGTCAIKAVTITDPFTVSFDANGGEDVASLNGTPSVTLPSALNGTKSLLGWFDAAEGGNKIGEAGESYTPTANITLHAQWEDVSTDARLASITFSSDAGTLSPTFDPEVVNYTYTMPYGTAAVPQITGATAVNAGGSYSIVSQASAWDETAVIRGVAASSDTKAYNITMKIAPKDGVCLVWADVPADNTLTYNATNSKFYAESDVTLQNSNVKGKDGSAPSGKKFQSNGFLKIALNEGTFLEGDVVALNVTYGTANVMHVFKAQAATSTDVIGEAAGNTDAGLNKVAITEDAATLWLVRGGEYADWNPHVDYVAVYRAMNPLLKAITINGETGTINEGAKTVAVELQPGYDLAALTIVPTIVSNTAEADVVKTVESNGGAWVIGDNTYRLTDKDGDYTDYTITLDRDVLKHTVSFNTHGGSAVESVEVVDGQKLAAAPADPTKEDYLFQGWAETEDGTIVDVTSFTITADKEFHAVWAADGAIKLLDGATVNHTNFITGVTADETVEFMGNEVHYAKFSGTVSGVNGVKDLTRVIAYNATTNKTKIRIYAHNNSTNGRNILVKGLVEGADAATDLATIALGNKEDKISDWIEFNNAANRTIYIFVPSSAGDVYFTQVKVIESGENAMKQAGEAGYALNLNKGRFFGLASTDLAFEGLNARLSGDYTALNSGYAKLNATSMSFTVASDMLLTVTANNNKTYYVTKDAAGTDNETAKTGASEFNLTAGTWFITAGTAEVQLTNIAFALPKCEQPTVTPMSNSDLCEGDDFAALTVSASVSDEGTLHYAWFKEAGATDEAVGTDAASFTPEADGEYYVIVTNQKTGYSDNSETSNTVSVEHFAAAVITTAPADVVKEVGQKATLSVVATGKNCTYEWFTCVDALGTNPVAIVPAETEASLTVTVAAGEQYYMVVVSSDCGAPVSAVAKVAEWRELTPANVTGSRTWDWTSAAWNGITGDIAFADTGVEELMANVNAKVPCVDGFRSDMLYGTGQYVWRSDNKFFQGTKIRFITTVPGKLVVRYRNTSGSTNTRTIKITNNGEVLPADGTNTTNSFKNTNPMVVKAGEVIIEGIASEENGLTRIEKIIFDADLAPTQAEEATLGGYERDVTEGRYGTICLPKAGIMVGAAIFELAYYSESDNKIFMDQVMSGEMVAGRPYVFLPNEGVSTLGVYYTDDEAVAAGDYRGLYGYYDGTDNAMQLDPGDGHYILYNNQFREVTVSHVWIDQNRAYFKIGVAGGIPTNVVAPLPGRRRMSIGAAAPQVTTGMDELNAGEAPVKVLINGELFILRGDKMFDATGRLIK